MYRKRNSYRAFTLRGLFASRDQREAAMFDLVFSALTLVLFLATIAYAYACERL